jgi:ABC-type bacteriocin/lantibiotic exporter with double-glycine peptidase domain
MQYKYQVNSWECGVVSIRNALLTLGVDVDRQRIRELARANHSGTSKMGIKRAIQELDFKAVVYQTKNPDYAYRWLVKWSRFYPIILLLDDMEHWGTSVGRSLDGCKTILIDSSHDGGDRMGAHVLDRNEVLSRWIGRGWYYAIRVSNWPGTTHT